MRNRLFRLSLLAIASVVLVASCLVEGNAQSRRRRSKRAPKPVITNPAITPADDASGEPKIISTADETVSEGQGESGSSQAAKSGSKKPLTEQEQMQRTINSLSNQVERLTDKLSQMQEDDKVLLDMERLTRAEQRAENLRTQLVDVESKLADFGAKLEQIEYSLRPESIERYNAGYGSVHPEEAREARRRQLESERARTQAQVRILETSKARLEASLVTADGEVDRLRRRLETREQQEIIGSTEAGAATSKPKPE